MLDLHCHILPGVDDGAVDLVDSLEMAHDAVQEGCRAVVATSHFGETSFDTSRELLRQEYGNVLEAIAAARIPLQVFLGAENYLTEESPLAFAHRSLPLGENGTWVLFDFSLREPPECVTAAIDALAALGRHAIIAHPERNLALMDDPSPLVEWVAHGARLQVNAASLLGLLGRDAQVMARWLLKHGGAHLLASDAHDRGRRPFCLGRAWQVAEEIVGAAEASRLTKERPWKVVANEPIDVPPLEFPGKGRIRG